MRTGAGCRDALHIDVVYAPDPAQAPAAGVAVGVTEPLLVRLTLPQGATVREAVLASGLLERLPGAAVETLDLGVFNRACTPERQLEQGDRVEIYRPLQIDPKSARHLRVQARRKADARARQLASGDDRPAPAPGPSSDLPG